MIRVRHVVLPVVLPVLACLCTDAAAQTFVVPPGYATKPGNSMEQQVFGFQQARYAQYVDKSELTGLPSISRIKEIDYRRPAPRLDKIYSSYEPMRRNAARPLPNWQIRIGNFTGDYANLSPQYEATVNKVTMTTVFAAQLNTTTNNPQLSAPPNASIPAPFAMKFPFNVTTLLYSGGGICVDHKVYSTRNYSHIYFVDSIVSTPAQGGDVSLISNNSYGCPPNMNRLYGTAPNPGAGSVKLHLFGAPKNTLAIAFLGANTSTYNGAPLPINLAFMGLASCSIYTDLSFPIATRTDLAGLSTVSIPVPGNSAYVGATIYSQWGIIDPRVNPNMGFALSDGVRIKIGPQVGAGLLRSSVISALGSQARNSFGYLQLNRGAIFQLIY